MSKRPIKILSRFLEILSKFSEIRTHSSLYSSNESVLIEQKHNCLVSVLPVPVAAELGASDATCNRDVL